MRVRLPDTHIGPPEARWKRGGVVEVETQDEVAELVARGGSLLDETEAAHSEAAGSSAAGKGKGKGK